MSCERTTIIITILNTTVKGKENLSNNIQTTISSALQRRVSYSTGAGIHKWGSATSIS